MTRKKKEVENELTPSELAVVRKAQSEITKADTPKVMEIIAQRKKDMKERTEQYCAENNLKGITYSTLMRIMTEGNSYINVSYTAYDMAVLLEWYKDICLKLQDQTYRHRPSRLQFCQIIGISSRTYEKMLMSDDPAMIEIMVKIEDYLQDEIYARANSGELQKDIAKHELEAVHGRIVVKKTESVSKVETVNVDMAKKRLEAIRNGGSVIDAEYTEVASLEEE